MIRAERFALRTTTTVRVGSPRSGPGRKARVILSWTWGSNPPSATMNQQIPADELLAELQAIENGDITIKPTGRTADETYCGDVTYRASNGWTIVVFNDCNCWDYLDSAVTPDGRQSLYPDGLEPWDDELADLFTSYDPPADVKRDVYGFTR